MKTLKPLNLRTLGLILATTALTGCLFPEDKGTIENVGTPVAGEGNFTVAPPTDGSNTTTPVDTNPTTPPVDTTPVETQPSGPDFTFTINNGDVYTNASSITLSVATDLPTFLYYKLSTNDQCDGGTWTRLDDSLAAQLNVTNFAHNAKNNYSVQFRDVDGTLADCLKASIIHDDQGPEIIISKYPMQSLEEGSSGEIIASVTDISPITSVQCSLNDISKACLSGTNVITLSQMPAGSYTFTIKATDSHGYSSTKSVSWTVVNKAKLMTQTVLIKDDRKVDVLIVIDNSGSMQYEQQSMAKRVQNMLTVLRGLDYRIGVTTTDPNKTHTSNKIVYYGDGDLIPIAGLTNKLWIDSTMDESAAQVALGNTLQRKETGSGDEQAILATYRFIEKATTPAPVGQVATGIQTFFRDGANFATLVISDEDESENTAKNDPENLLKLISTQFANQKAYSWHSIITKPGDLQCKNTYGATYGERYAKLSGLTGGIIGSVCEADYAAQVSGIATEIRNLIKNITLSCAPLEGYPITVKKDGVAYAVPYTVEGLNLKFADAMEPGTYTVDYACLK